MTNDIHTIQETITQVFVNTDAQNWSGVEAQFAPTVTIDYQSMTGNPATTLHPTEITAAWKTVLPGFTQTHHQLGNFITKVNNTKAHVSCYGTATHYLEDVSGNVWTVVGSYDFDLKKIDHQWKVTTMKFNYKYQVGNTTLVQKAIENVKKTTTMKKINFTSEGLTLVGNLYYPANYEAGKQYPTIVCSGSWTTVKEQMAGLYAERFAQNGFISLAFDFRNYGESEGEPRSWENPAMKIQDIKNAVAYLKTLPEVDHDNIGAFGVCAGAMYTLMAASEDASIKAVATTASWLHDAEAVKLFYGGEEGVQRKIAQARVAKKKYATTGTASYIKAISTTDETAAMFGNFDYYFNPERGAIPQWNADQFAVATWEDWLTLNPFPSAKKLTKPVHMIHSDGCVLPDYTKKYFEAIASTAKELVWIETELASPMHQFSFYDQEKEVGEAVAKTSAFFRQELQ
jgi:fermentation-respiration switch protein FrsA (DUF1100 family)